MHGRPDTPQRCAGERPRPVRIDDALDHPCTSADRKPFGTAPDGDRAGRRRAVRQRRDRASRKHRVGGQHEVRRLLRGPADRIGRAVRAAAGRRNERGTPKARRRRARRCTCSPRWPVTTVARGQPAAASSRSSCREHRPPVDRQHRLRVTLGERPQASAQTRCHDHGAGSRPERPERTQAAHTRCAGRARAGSLGAARAARAGSPRRRPRSPAGGPNRASASAAANRRASAPSSSRTSWCSSCGVALGADDQALVDEEVGELAARGGCEPARVAGQIAEPTPDELRARRSLRRPRARARAAARSPRAAAVLPLPPARCAVCEPFLQQPPVELEGAARVGAAARAAERVRRVAGVESGRGRRCRPPRARPGPGSGRTRASRSPGTRPRPRHARCGRSRSSRRPRACRS